MNLDSRERDKALRRLTKSLLCPFSRKSSSFVPQTFSLFSKREDKVSPELSTPPQTSAIIILSTSAFDRSSNHRCFGFFPLNLWFSALFRCFSPFRRMEYCKSQLGIIMKAHPVRPDVSLIRCVPTGVCDCVRSSFSYYLSGAFTWTPF